MTFYRGQKVVHIGFPWDGLWMWIRRRIFPEPPEVPAIGEVYTVANIIWYPAGIAYCLELVEISSPETRHWCAGFAAEGFRPAVEQKTDISIFTRMLTPKKEPVHS